MRRLASCGRARCRSGAWRRRWPFRHALALAALVLLPFSLCGAVGRGAGKAPRAAANSTAWLAPSASRPHGVARVPALRGCVVLQAGQPPAPVAAEVQSKKAVLLAAVARVGRGGSEADVLRAARDLEEAAGAEGICPQAELVEGRWSLVYSTQTSANAGQGDAEGIIDRLTAQAYRFFFKFAPALAGAQGGTDASQSLWGTPRNEQTVDLSAGTVKNTVEIKFPSFSASSWRARVVVEGEAEQEDAGSPSLRIVFTRFSVDAVGDVPAFLPRFPPLPLPRPRGRVDTTFVDGDLRLSRGGRGGVFVLKRIGPAPANAGT